MDFPPIEWVDGDLHRAREFTLLELVFVSIGVAITTALLWVDLGGQLGTLAYPAPLVSLTFLLAPIGAYLGGLVVSRVPRQWAVVRRLGISPIEIHLRYSFHRLRFSWDRVRWRDPDHLEVLQWSGSLVFLLTKAQADRIRRFFQYGQPLPSSVPRGR